mmetsp:Transcript_9151/g.15013  ORF Transcript_9151/g.15013 Transcript_9151/m.15013 type:complete len:269 (+) Transcript_9151:1516-2322(+)|eukprot:CAMPEP_0184366420 /NCGR_PEP_ID=MMETSP1089-20130417/153749_1 /TAXON_ID=38269 ORGANISM="Gloeochaete wittrockiana, Strain SAG46.84" /NCGR_SAMPLE_ID=MMETSP1089 /ASSEMBLY_ACC=CAM_ASM_000445 /LENGTH=268 /DNA_ID=CAMNT_0026707995 /DNA_START=341 /DNA_END=1147 /DNA_ORIENTATION=-
MLSPFACSVGGNSGPESIVYKGSSMDLVTEVDKESEEIIKQTILEAFPGHTILGEEGTAELYGTGRENSTNAIRSVFLSPFLWVIDPLDGTLNFANGIPLSVVSIGVASNGKGVVGVIYDPYRDEMFSATKGQGAFLNGSRVYVQQKEESLKEAIIATGFPVDAVNQRPLIMNALVAFGPLVQSVRASGAAALHLAWLAAGRLTAFWEVSLHCWDIVAGSVLVTEAGGVITDTRGGEYKLDTRDIVATNGKVHNAVLEVLNTSDTTGL